MNYEPKEALYAGHDGLDIIRPFLSQALTHLNPRGQVWLEFGTEQKSEIARLVLRSGWHIAFHKDQYGKWRYVVISK